MTQVNNTPPLRYIEYPPRFPYTETQVKDKVSQLSANHPHPTAVAKYQQGLALFHDYEARVANYMSRAHITECDMQDREVSKNVELQDLTAKKEGVEHEIDARRTARASVVSELEDTETERVPLVEKLRYDLLMHNLGDYEPTMKGVAEAFRRKYGYEDIHAVRNEFKQAEKDLDEFSRTRLANAGSRSLLNTDWPLKHHLSTLGLSVVPGIFTGWSFGTITNFIKTSELMRGDISAATFGSMVLSILFGVGFITMLGVGTERVTHLAYEDNRQHNRVSKFTIFQCLGIVTFLAAELTIDTYGINVLLEMYDREIPMILVLLIALALALPIVWIKLITTTHAIRKRLANEPDLNGEETLLTKKQQQALARLKTAQDDDKAMGGIFMDQSFGTILVNLKEIETKDRIIEIKKNEITKIDQAIGELGRRSKDFETIIYTKTAGLQVDDVDNRRFEKLRDEIQQVINEAKKLLS